MGRSASRFRDDLARHEQTELDANAGESDSLSSRLRARRDIVVAGELAPLHAAAIVQDRERRVRPIREQADVHGPGIERVGDDFSEDRLLERARIGVPQVFEQMLEVDPSFTHAGILARGSRARSALPSLVPGRNEPLP